MGDPEKCILDLCNVENRSYIERIPHLKNEGLKGIFYAVMEHSGMCDDAGSRRFIRGA